MVRFPLFWENKYNAYNSTCIGAAHIKHGKVCQDYSLSVKADEYSLAVLCDGHGGDDYFRSDRGSRFAAEIFAECVADKKFVKYLDDADSFDDMEKLVRQLIKSVILRWNNAIAEDMSNNPFSAEELAKVSDKARLRYENGEKLQSAYGTTLIGFVISKRYCFGVQIGDGNCIVANKWGQLTTPIPWDEKCFLNVTTSLSDENAYDEFRIWIEKEYSKNFPVAVFLSSDGIDDSFANVQKLKDFCLVVLKNISEADGMTPIDELFKYLPILSEKGSGDDMSLCLMTNNAEIKRKKKLWQGSGRRILFENEGDMYTDGPRDYYENVEIIPAEVGTYTVWTNKHDRGSLEVLDVNDDSVKIKYRDVEYVLNGDSRAEISFSETQNSYDGHWYNAVDTTKITLL